MKQRFVVGAVAAVALTLGGLLAFTLAPGTGHAAPPPTPPAGTSTIDPSDCPMFGGSVEAMQQHMGAVTGSGALDLQSMQQRMDSVHGAGTWDKVHGPNGVMPFTAPATTPRQ